MRIKSCLLVAAFIAGMSGNLMAYEDIQHHPKCKYSGMDREKFAHSRILVVYDDGSSVGTGSLRCASIDLAINFTRKVKSMKAGDYKTKNLIDAGKAYWVIGGKVKGVMTKNPKWAFEKKEDAQAFINENGGTLTSFDTALKTTYNDMMSDTSYLHDMMKGMKGNNGGHGDSHHGH